MSSRFSMVYINFKIKTYPTANGESVIGQLILKNLKVKAIALKIKNFMKSGSFNMVQCCHLEALNISVSLDYKIFRAGRMILITLFTLDNKRSHYRGHFLFQCCNSCKIFWPINRSDCSFIQLVQFN